MFQPEYIYGGTTRPRDSEGPQVRPYYGPHPRVLEVWFSGTHSDMYVLLIVWTFPFDFLNLTLPSPEVVVQIREKMMIRPVEIQLAAARL